MVVLLESGRSRIQLHRRHMRPYRPMLTRIVRVAVPNLFESGGHWLGNFLSVVIIGYLAHLGMEHNPVGTNIIAITIEALSFLPGYALGIAAATVVGQYLGAGDVPTARRAMWICLSYGAALMGFMGLLFIVVPDVFVWMLTDEQPYVTDAPPLLRVIGIGQLGFAAYLSIAGGLRGAGDTRTTMYLTYASLFGVRLPLAWVFGVMLGWGLLGVWIAFTIELTARGLLFFARFLHGGWTKIKV
jgi:Na+-driven multidrug efflux pump